MRAHMSETNTTTKTNQSISGAQRASKTNQQGKGDAASAPNAIELLKKDHRAVEALFAQFEKSEAAEKAALAQQICRELIVHTMLEEEIFYAACRDKGVEDDLLDEAQVEHDGAKVLIADIMQASPNAPMFEAKITVLSEYVRHHVAEEEKPRWGILSKAKAAGLDLA